MVSRERFAKRHLINSHLFANFLNYLSTAKGAKKTHALKETGEPARAARWQ